jgi:beta-galactosidase
MATSTELAPRPITAGDHTFRIEGTPTALYGGAVHYWRLDRDTWSGILDTVKDLGFTTISIYMPWEVHEIERGRFDWGQVDPRNDLDAFLTLIEEKDLNIVARPGPQINSELTWFGYPRRILEDPELAALNAEGTRSVLTQVPRPIPALAYGSDKFYEETALWYDAIMPILARHAYPKGRLVAAQVDNEMAFFFGVNAYSSDFSPSAVARYRTFLADRYGSLEELNALYGTAYDSFEQVEPPRQFDARETGDIPFHTDWVAYRERYLIESMGRLGDMMRERGLDGIPLFHNYPHPLGPGGAASGFTTPFNIMELEERLDFVGFDIYSRKELYDHVKTVVSYVVGTSRFPYIPEFIAGVWPWYLRPGELYDEEFVTKAALMHGTKGFSRYMLVERDRWLDSPIRRDGRVRDDHAAMFRRANEVLTGQRFVDLRRQADVLLLSNRDYDRLEAASVLVGFPGDFLETPSGFSEYPSFMTVAERRLGFAEPIQMVKGDRFVRSYKGLTDAGYPFLLSDTALPADRWHRFKALVVATYEYLGGGLQRDLVRFAQGGGIVVIGPRIPELDERMRPDRTLADALAAAASSAAAGMTTYAVGAGRIVVVEHLSDPKAAIEAALGSSGLLRFQRSDPRIDVTIHRPVDGTDRLVVFVANPTDSAIDAEVRLETPFAVAREVWDDRVVATVDGAIREAMPPYTIKIFECTQ